MKFVIATLIFANIGCLYKNIKRDKKLKQKEQELIFSENKKDKSVLKFVGFYTEKHKNRF